MGTPRGIRPMHERPLADTVATLVRNFGAEALRVARDFHRSAKTPAVADYWTRVIVRLES